MPKFVVQDTEYPEDSGMIIIEAENMELATQEALYQLGYVDRRVDLLELEEDEKKEFSSFVQVKLATERDLELVDLIERADKLGFMLVPIHTTT